MKIAIILKIVGVLYKAGLREIIIKFIDDPENKWDEVVIKALDELFGYSEKVKN